ncbi:MAG: hypothetical protein JWR69_224 [Pedosphaera sp.]|nr:hypothetical protein [Pedosphaera sp.]
MVLAARGALTLATLSTSCLFWLGYTSGIWSLHPELRRTGSHTKGVHRSKCFGGVKIGVPSRILSSNLEFRTLPLRVLSYGDKESNPWPVSSTGSHPALSKISKEMKGLGRSICFAFRDSKWYACSVTLRNPALI